MVGAQHIYLIVGRINEWLLHCLSQKSLFWERGQLYSSEETANSTAKAKGSEPLLPAKAQEQLHTGLGLEHWPRARKQVEPLLPLTGL